MTSTVKLSRRLAALVVLTFALPALSQPNTVHKTTSQHQPFPPPVYHTVTVRTVVEASGEVLPHTHPGVEMA
jgi:hypothetical protein